MSTSPTPIRPTPASAAIARLEAAFGPVTLSERSTPELATDDDSPITNRRFSDAA